MLGGVVRFFDCERKKGVVGYIADILKYHRTLTRVTK